MCYSSLTIANYFVEKSNGSKTPMQLNKLTYIAHGWNLAINNKPLIAEPVEAWKYGPVISVLYHTFKVYGNLPVPYVKTEEAKCITDDDRALLDKVFSVYDKYDAIQLSTLAHMVGTPWHITWYGKGRNGIIPNDLIKQHYVNKAIASADATDAV
jgi:uncharacterized phage-associated protein